MIDVAQCDAHAGVKLIVNEVNFFSPFPIHAFIIQIQQYYENIRILIGL